MKEEERKEAEVSPILSFLAVLCITDATFNFDRRRKLQSSRLERNREPVELNECIRRMSSRISGGWILYIF